MSDEGSTLPLKLDIDGRSISRLLTILTPLIILLPSFLFLPCPSYSHSLADLQLIYLGCNQAVLSSAWRWARPDPAGEILGSMLQWAQAGNKHLLRPLSDRHLIFHREGDRWEPIYTHTHAYMPTF